MNELIKTLLTNFAAKPTGSRVLGGVTSNSDWDFYTSDSYPLDRWLYGNEFIQQLWIDSEYDARSWRHKNFPINVIVCDQDYYHAFNFAAQSAALAAANNSLVGDETFSTRDGRVAFFKKRLREWYAEFDARSKIETRQPM